MKVSKAVAVDHLSLQQKAFCMNELYPMKFTPLFREKVWGGQRIGKVLGLDSGPLENCGEAWILSGVEGAETLVANGFLAGNDLNELAEVYMGDLLGDDVYDRFGDAFPLLVKFIDSNDWLSVQVHPDDALARRRHHANGKSEMWYVVDAVPGAELISGFARQTDRENLLYHLREDSLASILHKESVAAGDVFFTPAGRIHAIGPGVLLAEIQQTSDLTYRIYDWNRTDEKGRSRELHTELALDALDFQVITDAKTAYTLRENVTASLIRSPQFSTGMLYATKALRKDYAELDSFVVLIAVEGHFHLLTESVKLDVKAGEVVLLPNLVRIAGIIPQPSARILEVYVS